MTKKKNKKKAKFIDSLNSIVWDGSSKGLKQEAKRLRKKQDRDYYKGN